jgi:ankyrin repeat protein
LIHYRVDSHHINSSGLTPVAFLFKPGVTEPASCEFFEMLFYNSFSNLNAQDKKRLTALHQTAAHGTAKDVQNLVRYGADFTLKTTRRLWTLIFCASSYDNAETFK